MRAKHSARLSPRNDASLGVGQRGQLVVVVADRVAAALDVRVVGGEHRHVGQPLDVGTGDSCATGSGVTRTLRSTYSAGVSGSL